MPNQPVDVLEKLDGAKLIRDFIAMGTGTVTPYGVVYDNGFKLEQSYAIALVKDEGLMEFIAGSAYQYFLE